MNHLIEIKFVTPLGEMQVIADDLGVLVLDFVDRKHLSRAVQNAWSRGMASYGDAATFAETAREQMLEFFDGKRRDFTFPTVPAGTTFQRRVWKSLWEIPFGQTISYGEQTRRLGEPAGAARAVASANGQNFLAIVIPCHRVIGAQGDLRGYGGGLERKRWLIDHECAVAGTAQASLFSTR